MLAANIDLEKAYDRVDWGFLHKTLKDFGLPAITVNLIMFCIKSSSLTLLWNGSKLPGFTPIMGLRQRDPMSPYLFVLVMEKLACIIAKMVKEKKWKPIHVSRGGPGISNLFFADEIYPSLRKS